MTEFNLPSEVVDFLSSDSQFVYDAQNCEVGKVQLKSYNELCLTEVFVDSEESPIEEDDPHAQEKGYYLVGVIDLIKECPAYGAEGVLVWLPDLRVFGQWDIDHWDLLIFPHATWSDIVAEPSRYLSAQWKPDLEIGEYLKPWTTYKFKLGKPF